MRWLTKFSLRLRSLFHRCAADRELDSELRFHVERQITANIAAGMSPAEARCAALREFGGMEQLKEECRDTRKVSWLQDLAQDLRYGARVLRKSPGFTAIAIITLALGIGANIAIFTILNSAALRLLPVPHADQLVTLGQNIRAANGGSLHRNVHDDDSFVSYSEYRAYAKENQVFSGLLAYSAFTETTLVLDKPAPIMGTLTSCNYFDVLEIRPERGRFFVDSDCAAPGESAVVVLNDASWRSTFGADPEIIGKTITLNRTSFRVVGIAPPGFDGTVAVRSAFWAPVTMVKAFRPDRDYLSDDYLSWLALIGRLKRGISSRQAAANLGVIASGMNSLQKGRITTVTLGRATLLSMPSMRTPLLLIGSLIMVAVGLVLLLACANIANLLLARSAGRRKEIAVRLTVGASRGRLIRQLLTESLLLAFIGGAAGALAAMWSTAATFRFAMAHMPLDPEIAFTLHISSDFRTWFYAFALSVITACFFGLAPALRASRVDLTLAMKEDGAHSQTGTISAGRLRNFLVGLQVAACMLLLLASGLLLHGLYRAQTIEPGFETKDVASVFLNLGWQGYDESRATIFMRSLRERIASLPGVTGVAQAECAPLSHDFSVDTGFTVPGRSERIAIEYNHVLPAYFSVVGIPILLGHGFAPGGSHDTRSVVITQSTASSLWPGQDPLGKTLRDGYGREYVVVGVAKDAQVSHPGESNSPYLYFPAEPQDSLRAYVLVRFAGGFAGTAKGIRDAVQSLDPEVPVKVTTLEDYLKFWRAPARVASAFSVILGILALLLASIGIYGMVSYGVSRRVREIGIRIALGADNRDVMWLVVRQAMFPVIAGVLIGMILCGAASSIFSAILFGVSPLDPGAFLLMPAFLLTVALAACYIPARRAMRVDPMVALRYE